MPVGHTITTNSYSYIQRSHEALPPKQRSPDIEVLNGIPVPRIAI